MIINRIVKIKRFILFFLLKLILRYLCCKVSISSCIFQAFYLCKPCIIELFAYPQNYHYFCNQNCLRESGFERSSSSGISAYVSSMNLPLDLT